MVRAARSAAAEAGFEYSSDDRSYGKWLRAVVRSREAALLRSTHVSTPSGRRSGTSPSVIVTERAPSRLVPFDPPHPEAKQWMYQRVEDGKRGPGHV